ncbi:MAG: hypothetical protein JSW47_14265 [Phycisphaerales bacterium]|nr:MAG: hypothetical protein JSW47_14265 [Phycisphaerales bacterium]
MSDFAEQLLSKIGTCAAHFTYDVLDSWLASQGCAELMLRLKSRASSGQDLNRVKRIYHAFQASYYGLESKGIETLTLTTMIYPVWARVLKQHLGSWDQFDSEDLSHVVTEEQSGAIFGAYMRMVEWYSKGRTETKSYSYKEKEAFGHLDGRRLAEEEETRENIAKYLGAEPPGEAGQSGGGGDEQASAGKGGRESPEGAGDHQPSQ